MLYQLSYCRIASAKIYINFFFRNFGAEKLQKVFGYG